MIDDKQSSIVRPKAVPPMSTPVLTPNTQQSPTSIMGGSRTPQQGLVEMGMMIRKHDSEATRLYDCIGQVKAFSYNSTELRWENLPTIEGNLCAYERQQIINNKISPSYAFAIINGDKSLIQPITSDMAQHADKLRLFYEVARNGRREVYCLHFLTEPECLRLHTFLSRCILVLRNLAEQQARAIPPANVSIDPQTQINGGQATPTIPLQQTPTNIYRQQQQPIPQQPMMLQNQTTPQFGNSRVNINQTPTRFNTSAMHTPQQQQQPIPQQPMMLQNQTTPQFGNSRVNINQTPTRLNTSAMHTPQQQQQQPQLQHQQQINSYPPPQIPLDLTNINFTRVTPTVPIQTLGQVEIPKPIEQTPFPPSPIPLTNGNNNNNTEDPTSSLKRLLNIRGQSGLENLSLDDGPIFPKHQTQQNLLDLMPPSAFEPITATPPSPVVAIGAERVKHRLSTQLTPTMNREHFRNVLLHLVQNDDHFLDIIYQACLAYPPTTTQ